MTRVIITEARERLDTARIPHLGLKNRLSPRHTKQHRQLTVMLKSKENNQNNKPEVNWFKRLNTPTSLRKFLLRGFEAD